MASLNEHHKDAPHFEKWLYCNIMADDDSLQWTNTIKSDEKEECFKDLGCKFENLCKQDTFNNYPIANVPAYDKIFDSMLVTKKKQNNHSNIIN